MRRILSIAMLAAMQTAHAGTGNVAPATLIKLSSSVLQVEVIRAQGGFSLGSGVVMGADWVMTNCHVTRDAQQISVIQGGLRLAAQAQRVDADHDLCLLHVRGIEAWRAAVVGQAAQLAIGQPLLAVGHTGGSLQFSAGEVAALHRLDSSRVIQASNYFNSGASGGGLFDADDRLVGILTFRLRGANAHYFAMPAEWLAREVRDAEAHEQAVGPQPRTELAFWERPLIDQPFFLQAAVLENDGRWDDLRALAQDWLVRDPSDAEPWYLLGLSYGHQDQPREARHAFVCSLALQPDFATARTALERLPPPPDASSSSSSEATAQPCHL